MSNYSTLADNDLLKEISQYNSRALEELYTRYSATFYTLIKKIAPDEKTAENILVEVFSIIWRKASMFDLATGNAYAWLVTLARNRAIDTVRRSRSNESLTHYDDKYEDFYIIPTLDPNIDDLDILSAKEFKPKIEKALAKLSDAQKYVIHLAYYEGFTLNEIADRLNIPLETVRNKVMIAFHNLKDYLIAELNNG